MPAATRTGRRSATPDAAARILRRAEDAALRAAADAEMDDPHSPVLALLAAEAAHPTGAICPRVLAYSLRNRVLLAQQAAQRELSLRVIGTYADWDRIGRPVRAGQTGLRVQVIHETGEPATADDDAQALRLPEPPKVSARMISLFSIDQTITDGPDDEAVRVLGEAPADRQAAAVPPSPAQQLRAALAALIAPAGFTVAQAPADQPHPVHVDGTTQTVYVAADVTVAALRAASAALAPLINRPPIR